MDLYSPGWDLSHDDIATYARLDDDLRHSPAVDLHQRPFFGGKTKMVNITADTITRYVLHRKKQGAANASINRTWPA